MVHDHIPILLIEDNPADARLIEVLLSSHPNIRADLRTCDTLAGALAVLGASSGWRPDVVLLDPGLPDSDPATTFDVVHAAAPWAPIVVLSGQADEAVALKSVRQGAQDYLVKGRIDTELLARSVRYAVERQRSAQALRESEERFQSFMNNSPAAAYMKDDRGRYVFANLLFETLFGIAPRAWLGKTDEQLWPADVAAALRENDAATLREQRSIEFTERLPCPQGPRDLLTLRFPVANPAGATFLGGMAVDITQRLRAEDALREAEAARTQAVQLQSETLNALPASVALVDHEGRILVVNAAWQRFSQMCGVSAPGYGVGRDYFEVALSAQSACTETAITQPGMRAVIEGRSQIFTHEYAAMTVPGGPRWYRMVVAPITIHHKRGAVVMHTDITDRKAVEEQLRASEERYRLVVETAQEAICLTDDRWRITLCNSRLTEMLGCESPASLGSVCFLDFLDETGKEAVSRLTREPSTAGQHTELRLVRPDGHELWASLTAGEIREHASGFRGVLLMLSDITQRRRTEQALRDADEQLRHAQKMEAVGMLASGVAHDFNNLLTAIRGYTSLARTSLNESHPARESLDQVEEASRQAAGVASALLTFARKTRSEMHPVRLSTIVESAARLFRRTLSGGVAFTCDVSRAADIWVNADESQLHQVVMNLGLNARDAIDNTGAIAITVEPAPRPRTSQPSVRIVVRDNGTGIAPDVLPRIFEPFFTTKPRGQGTGLGLSVIHGIVQEHGGTVSVESETGKGTTFTVLLPIIAAPVYAAETLAATPPIREQRGLALVVFNSPLVRGVVASMLSSLNYDAIQASSMRDARTRFGTLARVPDVLVSDAILSDSPAEELLSQLRATYPSLRALFISDLLPLDDTPDFPGVRWLRKPFRVNDLQDALTNVAQDDEQPEPGEEPHNTTMTPGENP